MYYIKIINYNFQVQFIHEIPICYIRDGYYYKLYSILFEQIKYNISFVFRWLTYVGQVSNIPIISDFKF